MFTTNLVQKVYLSGPMRGLPNFNFPAFHAATAVLRNEYGLDVFNPAEQDEALFGPESFTSPTGTMPEGLPHVRAFIATDLAWITSHADAIVVLPGWEKSSGALAELATARAIGIVVLFMSSDLKELCGGPLTSSGPEPSPTPESFDNKTQPEKGAPGIDPKARTGQLKPKLHLVPPALTIHTAMALESGVKKHGGEYNWRANKISLNVYIDGVLRHMACLMDGEDLADDTGVHHCGHAAAGLAIILDAFEKGNLVDDRPLKGNASDILKRLTVKPSAPTPPPVPESAKSLVCQCDMCQGRPENFFRL